MKIFFAVSYSSKVTDDGSVMPEYRKQMEELIDGAEQGGNQVYCAPKHDGWQINNISPGDAYKQDIAKLDNTDAVVAFLEKDNPSTGVCMEIMRANMRQKPLLILSDKGNPVYMITGMLATEKNVSHKVCPDTQSQKLAIEEFIKKHQV